MVGSKRLPYPGRSPATHVAGYRLTARLAAARTLFICVAPLAAGMLACSDYAETVGCGLGQVLDDGDNCVDVAPPDAGAADASVCGVCAAPTPRCDSVSGRCVECLSATDCTAGATCLDGACS